jgi:hypothetical protein
MAGDLQFRLMVGRDFRGIPAVPHVNNKLTMILIIDKVNAYSSPAESWGMKSGFPNGWKPGGSGL